MSAPSQKMEILLTEDEKNMVLAALVKHIPIPVKNPFVYGRYGMCPSCDKVVSFDEHYCSECGQKLLFEVKPMFQEGEE